MKKTDTLEGIRASIIMPYSKLHPEFRGIYFQALANFSQVPIDRIIELSKQMDFELSERGHIEFAKSAFVAGKEKPLS